MWDTHGHDVTRDLVAPIPGVIPTVKIGPAAGSPNTAPAVDEGVDPVVARAEDDLRCRAAVKAEQGIDGQAGRLLVLPVR